MRRRVLGIMLLGALGLVGCAAKSEPNIEMSSSQLEASESGSGSEGCWVHLYDGDDFDDRDDNFKLTKPGRYENLTHLPGADQDWTGEADSLKVGPRARVTVWPEEDFTGEEIQLDAGTEDSALKNEPRSLQLVCN